MSMKVVIDSGLAACQDFFSFSALCLGAGTDRATALKVGAIFAASKAASEAVPKYQQLLAIVATSMAYRQASLILGSSLQVAKLAMVVKLVSLSFVQTFTDLLIDGVYSKDQGDEAKKIVNGLISGVTVGILTRLAGSSNNVAAATAAVFSVTNLVHLYNSSRIREIEKILPVSLSEKQLFAVKLLLLLFAGASAGFTAGRTLRPWIAQ